MIGQEDELDLIDETNLQIESGKFNQGIGGARRPNANQRTAASNGLVGGRGSN